MFRCNACGAINRIPAERPAGGPICGNCKTALDTSGAPQDVSGDALARAISSSPIPVLVDFWAPWCAPCHAVAPIVEQVARDHAGELLTLKLNTEQQPAPSAVHGIRAIPTFVLFRDGQEIARQSGALPREQFSHWVSRARPPWTAAGGPRL